MDMNTIIAQMDAMEKMLDGLYDNSILLVAQFTNLGRAIGSVGALVYISAKVWGHLARAARVDVFPLLRPFLIGLCILLFPQVCGMLRSITSVISHSTDSIRTNESARIDALQAQKKAILDARPENQYFATNDAYEQRLKDLEGVTNIGDRMSLSFDKLKYDVNQNFREWMKNTLELFHVAARLLISVLATFLLIILSVLGPLTFGIAIFPGFGGGIAKWLGNFVTISLWVPVANIFGTIMNTFQIQMLQGDIDRLNSGAGVDSADFGYLVFLCIAIAGYLIIPKVTELLIQASGAGHVASAFMGAATGVAAGAGATAGLAGRAGVAGAATGMGSAVGFGQGLLGQASMGTPTRGEQLGHRAGTALREKAQGYFGRRD
jgi:conjugative transposon TraJ protein